jgi:outer membrane cobalamin receptor
MKRKLSIYFSILSIFFYNYGYAQIAAQDTVWESSVKEILNLPFNTSNWHDIKITTASRAEELSSKAPAMIRVVTEEQIRRRCYRSLVDLIRDLPDFKVDDAAIEQSYSVITTRGVHEQSLFVVLLDGVRISSPTNENMMLLENYPLTMAKQVEIVYGAASALYGADALAGIINIISKEADKKNIFEITPTIGNHNLYNISGFTSIKLHPEVSLTLSGTYHTDKQADLSQYYKSDTLFDLRGNQTGTFNTIFGKVTPTAKLSPNFEQPILANSIYGALKVRNFRFSIFRNYAESSTSISSTPQNSVYNNNVFYGQRLFMGSANYQRSIGKVTFNSLLMGSEYEVNPESNFRNIYTGMELGYGYALGKVAKLEQQISWQIHQKLTMTSGITYESFFSIPLTANSPKPINTDNAINSVYLGTTIPMRIYTISYSNTGGFMQLQYNPSQKLAVTVGSRLDYNSRFGATFNPRLGLVWNPTPKTTIKALYGSAFLAPSPEKAFGHYGSFTSNDGGKTYQSSFWHLPNPNLQPIYSKNLEFGFRQLFGNNLALNLNIYHTWLSNLYDELSDKENENLYNGKFLGYDVGRIVLRINQGNQRNYGGTLQLDYRKEMNKNLLIEAYAALSYIDGVVETQIDNKTEEITAGMITPMQFKMGFDIRYKKFTVSLRGNQVGTQILQKTMANNPRQRQEVEGYFLLNGAIRYNVYKESWLFINIFNALDQRYRNISLNIDKNSPYYFAGMPQQPIRISTGIQIKF